MSKINCKVMSDIKAGKDVEPSRDWQFMFCNVSNAYRCKDLDCIENRGYKSGKQKKG